MPNKTTTFPVCAWIGWAECIEEPRGRKGLEGYNLGDEYRFKLRKDQEGKQYIRIYPDPENKKYYETCGTGTFRRFFKGKEQ